MSDYPGEMAAWRQGNGDLRWRFRSPEELESSMNALDVMGVADTLDRPADAYTKEPYARSGKHGAAFKNEPGNSFPKAGAFAEAGVGGARAEYSVFEAEVKGANASAGAEASAVGVGAMARAEVGSACAKAGPVGVKLGLGVDTGLYVGATGIEAKALGTGFTIGQKNSLSVLGSEVSCSVM